MSSSPRSTRISGPEGRIARWQHRNVSIADFLALAGNFGSSYTGSSGAVSAADIQTVANFASSIGADPSVVGSAVPEPGTLSLLAVGAMGRLDDIVKHAQ